jgi:hypothetical protein
MPLEKTRLTTMTGVVKCIERRSKNQHLVLCGHHTGYLKSAGDTHF